MERCLRIKGRVQGVGFRYWTVRKAMEIGGLSGYVYNEDDGDVLIYISGSEENLAQMEAFLYKGPLFARVDKIENAPDCKIFFPPLINGVFKRL